MLALSRAGRFLAGFSIVLLAIPLALSTPWAKSAVLGAATAWARSRFGVDIRAAGLDYRLTALTFRLEDVAVADPATPNRPFLTIAQLDLDLAASALRGRLDFDRIIVLRPSVVLDSTTRPSRRAAGQGAPDATPPTIPAFEIAALEIQDLDLVAGDTTDTRVVVRQLTTTLYGHGSQRLDGDVVATGGVGLSFGTAANLVAFDRVEASVVVDGGRHMVGGSLSAHSPVAEVRAEGDVPLDAARGLDLRYEAAGQVAELGRWWSDTPDLRGRATVRGRIRGALQAPEASFEAASPDLAWSSLAPAALSASGRVSPADFELDAFSLVSVQGAIDGRGRLAFDDADRSVLNGQWRNLSVGAAAEVLALPAGTVPQAVVSGSTALSWPGLRPALHRLEGRLEATASARAPDDAAVGTLVAEGRHGRWQLDYRQGLDGLTRASLESVVVVNADRLTHSTVAGSVNLQSQDLRAALLQLRRLGLRLPADAAAVGSERVAFDGAIGGSLDAPRVRGNLSAEGVHLGAVTEVRVQGTVGLDAHALELAPLTIESVGNRAVIQGTLPWTGAGGEGTFEAHVAQPEHLASMVPVTWRPAGTFDVSGQWRGSAQAPRVTARLSGADVTANGLTFESVSADLELADRIVRVARLHATQPHGSLDGTGAWNFEDSTLVADAAGTGLDMSILAPDDSATLVPRARLADVSIDAHADGAVPRLAGRASLTAGAVEIDGQPLGRVQGQVDAAAGVAHVTAGAPEVGASADGRVALDAPWAFEGRLALVAADPARLGHLGGLDLDGVSVSFDATADTSGTFRDPTALHAAVALTRLEGQIRERPLTFTRAGRVLIEDGVVRVVEPMHLTLGATTLDIAASGGATPEAGVLVTLNGPLADVTSMVPSAVPEGVSVDGTVRAEVRLGPRLAALAPTGLVTLDVTALRRGDRELARGVKVVAEGDAGMIRVSELTGTVLGSPVEARGTAPMAWVRVATGGAPSVAGEPATFSLRSVVAVGPMLTALTDRPLNITGTVNLALEGSASAPRLDAVHATLVQQAGDMTLSGVALTQQTPTRLRLEQGRLLVEAFEWRGPESTVVASGTVGLADGVDGRLQLDGDGSLALLTLFVPARVSGRAKFDVEVSGTAGARTLLGTIGIDDGNMVVQPWRVAMADWSGTVVFGRDSIAVTGLRGQFNGGEATIEGRIPVRGDGSAAPPLAVAIRGAFLELPRGLRSQLDADFEWSHAGGRARLAGNATVTAQTYREPATELARIASMLVNQSGRSPVELPAALAGTALDVRLATIGPLAMTNSVARVELMPELQLTGTVGRPALVGEVAVADDGRIQFGGRQYRFRDSRVEFSAERGMVPRLDLTADTRVGDYTVHLRLSGAANEIETSLSSDPPLGERDLQTLLVTGQRETLGRGSDVDQTAVGAVSGDVLGVAGQFLGFDSVVVGTTDDLALVSSDVDPALRLTVSKRLGNRFELVLSDNLDDNELTWVVIYRPRPGFEFRVVSRDNTEFTGEFRQEIPFGPGVSPPRTTARRQAVRDRIAAVTVSGDPGLTPADVLSATGLQSGDHFDFGRWLEDRERIAQRYVEHGYFSARIVPTRRLVEGAADGARVALDYRITHGPRTVLLVEGYSPPPALLEQLRQAWADSALLELLDVDLERVMRQHFVASGYLRATLAVDVDDSTPDLVTATVKAEAGPLSSDRRLGFSGNSAISDNELRAVAQARTVVTGVPWLDPEPLLDALESAYAARGYLAAKATAGAIVFSNGSATLPIHVVEGPLARVATLSVDGAERVGEADAAAGTGLTVGATYLAGGEQAARLALERYYRNLGYRDVTVESQTTVNAGAGRVDVAVTVHEGPRYVVESVRTSGVESTRDALVERATRVEPGSAASPANVEAIRRRLYDLGTFRSAEVTYAPVGAPSTDATVPVDAIVALQESRRFLFLYGVEATNQYLSVFDQRVTSGGVAADLRDRNFLGRGWTLGAGARYEPSFWSTRLLGSVPRLGSRRIRTNLYADRRSEDRAGSETVTFRDAETAVTLEQRWRPRPPVEFSWGYRFDYRDLQFVSVETGQRLLGFDGYFSSLAGAVVVDRRDSMFDAKRGWLMSTSAEWGLQPLGSDFDYLRTLVRASHYQPLGPLTMASNVRWGRLEPFGGRPPLTALDLFYQAGGTQTVRGYQQDSLSAYELRVPGSSTPVPVGGTSLLVLNEEVRFPLFGRLSGAAFADAGNTFTEERGIVLGDLAVGLGVGLRIRTPLAPVRIDLGFPVPRRPGDSAVRWHFSIGQIF